jgi:DNA-binding transcriptional MerR regulator
MAETVPIGKAAKLAGTTVDTIRFYHKLGLVQTPTRSTSGYRLFDDQKIRDLRFVRRAQELGFSLDEIKELLALRQKQHACSDVQSMLKSKLTDVRAKIEGLVDLHADLRGVLRNCDRELPSNQPSSTRTAARCSKGLAESMVRTEKCHAPPRTEPAEI